MTAAARAWHGSGSSGAMRNALKLVKMPHDDEDLHDTLPPTPDTEPPPAPEGISTLEEVARNEDPESWAGYDESKFMHRATASVIKLTTELMNAKQTWDIEAIVKRQAVLFGDEIKPQFKAIGDRIGRNEVAVNELRSELARMREEFQAKINHLEAEISRLSNPPGQQQ